MKGGGFEAGSLRGQGCTNRARCESDISVSGSIVALKFAVSSDGSFTFRPLTMRYGSQMNRGTQTTVRPVPTSWQTLRRIYHTTVKGGFVSPLRANALFHRAATQAGSPK